MNRYEVVAGNEFHVADVTIGAVGTVAEVRDAALEVRKARVQERLTYLIFGALVLALALAAAYGAWVGSFAGLNAVWSAAALPIGFILRTYFEKSGK